MGLTMHGRPFLLFIGAALLMAAIAGPTGRIAIQTHEPNDASPQRVEASIALGKAALSLLITWTSHVR